MENADLKSRAEIAREHHLRQKGEIEQLRKELSDERLNNGADRRRLDLLVALCVRARSASEGVRINTGEELHLNPPNLRAVLDLLLESGVAEPLPA